MTEKVSPLTVLHVIDSLVADGAERSMLALARPLRESGIDLQIAYLREGPGLRDEFLKAGVRLFSLDGGGRLDRVRRLRRLIATRAPDIVHTSLFEGNIIGRTAARLAETPVVSSLTGEPYGPEQLTDPRLSRWKLRAAQALDMTTARFVGRFHSVSGHTADVMARRLRIPRDRIEIIPRGRDPQALGTRSEARRLRARAKLGVSPGTPVALAAARHEHQKGLDILVEAFPKVLIEVPEARLLVAGREGSATEALRTKVKLLGLDRSVSFIGARDDIPDLLCAADVFVLPSRWEGFPGVLMEAMALATPIVASDLEGVREVLGPDGIGLRVRPGDTEALAGAVRSSVANGGPGRPEAAGRKRFLSSFTIEAISDRMGGFYRRVIGKRR